MINDSGSIQAPLLTSAAEPEAEELRDFTLTEAVATLDFWILFVAFLFSSGAGLVLINNLGQVSKLLVL